MSLAKYNVKRVSKIIQPLLDRKLANKINYLVNKNPYKVPTKIVEEEKDMVFLDDTDVNKMLKNIDGVLDETSKISKKQREENAVKELEVMDLNNEVSNTIGDFVVNYQEQHKVTPSNKEIIQELGVNKDQIFEYQRRKDMYNDLVLNNSRLIVSEVKKLHNPKGIIGMSELYSEGTLGLVKGLNKFDHRRGFKISTAVVPRIEGAIKRYKEKYSKLIDIPSYIQERYSKIMKFIDEFKTKNGYDPNMEDIINNVEHQKKKLTREEIEETFDAMSLKVVPFDTGNRSGEETYSGEYQVDYAGQMLQEYEKEVLMDTIKNILDQLTPFEERLLRIKFGVGIDNKRSDTYNEDKDIGWSEKEESFSTMGQKFNVNHETVRQQVNGDRKDGVSTGILNRIRKQYAPEFKSLIKDDFSKFIRNEVYHKYMSFHKEAIKKSGKGSTKTIKITG